MNLCWIKKRKNSTKQEADESEGEYEADEEDDEEDEHDDDDDDDHDDAGDNRLGTSAADSDLLLDLDVPPQNIPEPIKPLNRYTVLVEVEVI